MDNTRLAWDTAARALITALYCAVFVGASLMLLSSVGGCATIAVQAESLLLEFEPTCLEFEHNQTTACYELPGLEINIVHALDTITLEGGEEIVCATSGTDVKHLIDGSENHWISIIPSLSDPRCEDALKEDR